MKKRISILTALCVVLLLTLTGCSAAKNTVSSAVSKIKDDMSETMSRVESFFEGDDMSSNFGDDTLSSGFDDDASGIPGDDWGSSGIVDDDWGSSGFVGDGTDEDSGATSGEAE